jgi:hypothetical protein
MLYWWTFEGRCPINPSSNLLGISQYWFAGKLIRTLELNLTLKLHTPCVPK